MTMMGSPLLYIFCMSLITNLLFYRVIEKYSKIPWLSMVIYVGLGSYYTSFNISREILACAILFCGIRPMLERNLKNIFLCYLCEFFPYCCYFYASFYYLLNINIKMKFLLVIIPTIFILLIKADQIVFLFQRIVPKYSVYNAESYGMTNGSFGNVLVPLFLFALCWIIAFFNNKFNCTYFYNENKIMFNAAFFFSLLIALMSTKIYLFLRLEYFLIHIFGY